jgi:hypothetical protein
MKQIYRNSTNSLMLVAFILILIIPLSGCSLPVAVEMDEQSIISTSVQATIQQQTKEAMDNQPAGSLGLVPVKLQANTPIPTNSVKTALPTPKAPTLQTTKKSAASSNSSNSDTTAPVIQNVSTSNSKVYYQDSSCGSTSFTVSADVTDNSGTINHVWVNYQIISPSAGVGGNQWYQEELFSSNGKYYAAKIDVSSIADSEIQGNDGTLQFQVFAMDASGNTQTEPNGFVYGVEVFACGVLGAPPVAPAASAISITNILLYPDQKVYYGACNAEPTILNIQATIDPLDQIQSAVIYYSYSDLTGLYGPYTVQMYQLGIGDYAGDIDTGSEVGQYFNQTNGSVDFHILVTDKNGKTTDTSLMSMDLEYCGGASNNVANILPTNNNVVGVISGDNSIAGNVASGNSVSLGNTVKFYNNTSHPIVELVIDGVDVILSESQSIVQGGWLDVDVSSGDHIYSAGNGYWSGGQKVSIYPLPGGTFNAQSGSVTIGDPSIESMLAGHYAGEFWDANVTMHCASFDFSSSGGFDFYIDGAWNDSGSYSLVLRQPSTYSVVFNVVNNAGTEQFNGTYSYTGAMAGTIQMYNGPSGWELIEYVSGGTAMCP